MKLFVRMIGCLILVALVATTSAADDDAKTAKLKKAVKEALKKFEEQQQQLFQRAMQMKVAEIQKNCELSDSQVKRLEIASKGAVERFTEKWSDSTADWLLQMAGEVDDDANLEDFAKNAIDEDMMGQFELVLGIGVVTKAIGKEPIWMNAMAKVLNAEQNSIYEDTEYDQERVDREATTNYLLSLLRQDYLLSNQQREDLRPLIEEMIQSSKLEAFRTTVMGSFLLAVNLYKIPKNKMQAVLDAEQMKIWERKLKQYETYFEMEDEDLVGPWRDLLENEPKE